MSLGGFLDSSGAGARLVGDIPYSTTTAGAMQQRRLVAPSLPKCIFSPGLSLALQTNLEGGGGGAGACAGGGEEVQEEMMRRIAEIGDFDAGGCGGLGGASGGGVGKIGAGAHKEIEEYESRSGSDNVEGSGDDVDVDAEHPPNKKKRYHRHTPHQIQELEALFKECPHPDEKQRMELSKRLCLESRQVKFWFQNRRTQMKAQLERHHNALLRQENEKLKLENMALRESMRSPICPNCGGSAALGDVSLEQQQLRLENARLRDEFERVVALAERFLGRPICSLAGQLPPHLPGDSPLELAVGGNGFQGLCPVPSTMPPVAPDYFVHGMSSAMPVVPPPPVRPVAPVGGMDRSSLERTMLDELALAAMDELMKMAQLDDPLWFRDGSGKEVINSDEYFRRFSQCTGPKPMGYVREATRETGVVIINSSALVDTLIDANRWPEMFPCVIAKASTTDVIRIGDGGSRSGALQLMRAELQVLSPLVPTRDVSFLRFCKQHADGVWAVVDVSVDAIKDNPAAPPTPVSCRRLPSGCLLQDMPNGYCKVTWVEHAEYDESAVHLLYRPLLRSGMALGAQRWVATLQRQCECLAILLSSTVPSREQTVISALGRRSMVKLAQRMTDNFCSGVCASAAHRWSRLNMAGAVGEDVRVMTRASEAGPGEPPGVVLSAATSVWVPVHRRRLFDFLRNEALRSEWDILSNGAPMQEVAHIAKGQDQGNAVSLLRASAGSANQSSMLILQETCTDPSGSLVVYAPVDIPAMHLVMNGGDSSCVALLPSGFAILPDGPGEQRRRSGGADGDAAATNGGSTPAPRGGGSLLTVAFQILVNSLPAAKLTVESVETVNNLISCTIKRIKTALHCDN